LSLSPTTRRRWTCLPRCAGSAATSTCAWTAAPPSPSGRSWWHSSMRQDQRWALTFLLAALTLLQQGYSAAESAGEVTSTAYMDSTCVFHCAILCPCRCLCSCCPARQAAVGSTWWEPTGSYCSTRTGTRQLTSRLRHG
jgi:hypothetical protein